MSISSLHYFICFWLLSSNPATFLSKPSNFSLSSPPFLASKPRCPHPRFSPSSLRFPLVLSQSSSLCSLLNVFSLFFCAFQLLFQFEFFFFGVRNEKLGIKRQKAYKRDGRYRSAEADSSGTQQPD